MSRLIIRSVVVLPQPEGPMRATIEPRGDVEAQRIDGGVVGAAETLRDLAKPNRRARGIRWGELRWGGQRLHGVANPTQ